MKTKNRINAGEGWGYSRWFAVLSPVIGVLLGLLGAFVFAR